MPPEMPEFPSQFSSISTRNDGATLGVRWHLEINAITSATLSSTGRGLLRRTLGIPVPSWPQTPSLQLLLFFSLTHRDISSYTSVPSSCQPFTLQLGSQADPSRASSSSFSSSCKLLRMTREWSRETACERLTVRNQ